VAREGRQRRGGVFGHREGPRTPREGHHPHEVLAPRAHRGLHRRVGPREGVVGDGVGHVHEKDRADPRAQGGGRGAGEGEEHQGEEHPARDHAEPPLRPREVGEGEAGDEGEPRQRDDAPERAGAQELHGLGDVRGARAPGACRVRASAHRLRSAPLSGLDLPCFCAVLSRGLRGACRDRPSTSALRPLRPARQRQPNALMLKPRQGRRKDSRWALARTRQAPGARTPRTSRRTLPARASHVHPAPYARAPRTFRSRRAPPRTSRPRRACPTYIPLPARGPHVHPGVWQHPCGRAGRAQHRGRTEPAPRRPRPDPARDGPRARMGSPHEHRRLPRGPRSALAGRGACGDPAAARSALPRRPDAGRPDPSARRRRRHPRGAAYASRTTPTVRTRPPPTTPRPPARGGRGRTAPVPRDRLLGDIPQVSLTPPDTTRRG
jgi:hypothetical protein